MWPVGSRELCRPRTEAEGKLVLGVVIYQLTWERNKAFLLENGISHIGWVVREETEPGE